MEPLISSFTLTASSMKGKSSPFLNEQELINVQEHVKEKWMIAVNILNLLSAYIAWFQTVKDHSRVCKLWVKHQWSHSPKEHIEIHKIPKFGVNRG